ncbi:hypothetical protein Tdes44962_MAKER06951 [Teratosphaeria destructans]|uniref:Uncharacterized protein n=1 Tax=Teratosphaeria destructans TaxID=418781 RepID=A0A9W7W6G0_9PEZI|nr:hypothetical protein Tdes44962_MAKER06951 [Teratosphaeria destructans]
MVWPFKRRRKDEDRDATGQRPPLAEKSSSWPLSPPAATATAPSAIATSPLRRRKSRKGSTRRRSRGQSAAQPEGIAPQAADAVLRSKTQAASGKENVPQRRASSIEDITALPVSRTLASSPHLRPVNSDRPPIPYTFRPSTGSQTSLQKTDTKTSRPQTLRSRLSGVDDGPPTHRRSSKRRRAEERIREEEIRTMSAPIAIPKRAGDAPLRRDSKKIRSARRGSHISLPPEESIHSSMSGAAEQRGWEVGTLDMFNPRPAVRLSGAPQYVPSGSVPSTSHAHRMTLQRDKMKQPETEDTLRKRQTIGEQADEFDASDLRLLLERDAKRRERKRKEQQESLDRKLRDRAGRNRGDSDRRRREAEEAQRPETAEETGRTGLTLPTAVHPALRQPPVLADSEAAVLGIGTGKDADPEHGHVTGLPPAEQQSTADTGTYLRYPQQADIPANPFADPSPIPSPAAESYQSIGPFTPVETPAEDPIGHTPQAVRMSITSTPPRSPGRAGQAELGPSSLAHFETPQDLIPPPALPPESRRASDPQNRRPGAWASFFKRGGTMRKPGDGTKSPSEVSFTNASRESMRNQALPAHLIDSRPSPPRRTSGTPARTQSRFREDLPEMPISPPESRMSSPDVTTMAAAAAAARRARRAQPVDVPGAPERDPETDPSVINRNDTPVTPGTRHGLMSASLASIGSEGSWLASAKRQSGQSGISRGVGSLSRRDADFVASYEELGGTDKDAEYVSRATPSSSLTRRISTPTALGGAPDEASEYGDAAIDAAAVEPITYHGSVRRQPTLVRRDLRTKSREALVTGYAAERAESPDDSADQSSFNDVEESPTKDQIRSARSIDYGKGHARQMSAGSARLLDIKRQSVSSGMTSPSAAPSPGLGRPG